MNFILIDLENVQPAVAPDADIAGIIQQLEKSGFLSISEAGKVAYAETKG